MLYLVATHLDFKNRDKILTSILDKKLKNNDKHIANCITDFLKCKCSECNKKVYHFNSLRIIHTVDDCYLKDTHMWRCDDCCGKSPFHWCPDMCLNCEKDNISY